MSGNKLSTSPLAQLVASDSGTPLAFGDGDLRAELTQYLRDPRIADPRTCLAVADYILGQRAAMIDGGESKRLLDDLSLLIEDIEGEVDVLENHDAREAIARTVEALRDRIDDRRKHHTALDQLAKANRDAMAAREAAARIETSRGAVIAREHMDAMVVEVTVMLRRAFELVDDDETREKVKAFIAAELDRIRASIRE